MTTISPRALGRAIAVFFLITLVAGIIAQGFIAEKLIVMHDSVATANNIAAHQSLYRAGFTIYMVEMSAQITTAVLFYFLLRAVNRPIATLALVFELVGITIKCFARVFYYVPLLLIGTPAQGQLSLLSSINDRGAAMALAFFGFSTLLQGWLIFKSTFLPRALGIIAMVAGLGWLTYLSPSLGDRAFMPVALVALIGALGTIGWLLFFGVNEEHFDRVTGAS